MTSSASTTSAPPAWYYKLGLHEPKRAGGQWVKQVRQLLETQDGGPVTQILLAEYLGVHYSTLAKYENATYEISFQVALKLLVQEVRLIGLGKLPVEDSLLGHLFVANAIPSGIKESTFNALINGLTAMRDRFIEESWTKSASSPSSV